MHLTCAARALRTALQTAARLVKATTPLPILTHVLLDAADDRVQVVATDLESAVVLTVPATVTTPGRATVPGRLFADWLQSLPDADVSLRRDARSAVRLEAGRVTTTLRGLDPADYPPVADPVDGPTRSLGAGLLRLAIQETAYAASPDESRPAMAGVLLQVEAEALECAAVDGVRLALRRGPLRDGPGVAFTALIRARAATELGRLCHDDGETVTAVLGASQTRIQFAGGAWQFSTRLIDASFPDYRQILPQRTDTQLTVERAALLQALRFGTTLAGLESREHPQARFVVTAAAAAPAPSTLTLSAAAREHGDHRVTVPVVLDGEPGRIALNGQCVREWLESCDTTQITFGWSGERSAAIFGPVGAAGPTGVIMAMSCSDWPRVETPEAVAVG